MKKVLGLFLSFGLAIIALLAGGFRYFRKKMAGEVADLYATAEKASGPIVTPDMLVDLPEPVRRYLAYSGIVGKPMVTTVRLKQDGRIRQSAVGPWMVFTAEEYYTVSPPGFIWIAGAQMAGLPLVRVRDKYTGGQGNMLVTAAGLVPMVDAAGEEMDQGGLMRYLNEMTWFPSSFLGKNVIWEAIDDASARVTLTDKGKSVSATMYFDEEGKYTNFVAQRYRDTGDGKSSLETWSTPITGYGRFEGLNLPRKGLGVWHLSDGDLTYIELEITAIEYNKPSLY